MNTSNDFSADFITHNEPRFCDKCDKVTVHRVGVQEQTAELTRYTVYMKHEYSHCDECSDTHTVQLEKVITPKAE